MKKLGLVYTFCACAELCATRGERGVCDLPVLFQGLRVEHSMHLKAPGEVVKMYWRTVFAVKVEAGDGMQQPSSIV